MARRWCHLSYFNINACAQDAFIHAVLSLPYAICRFCTGKLHDEVRSRDYSWFPNYGLLSPHLPGLSDVHWSGQEAKFTRLYESIRGKFVVRMCLKGSFLYDEEI